MEDFIGWLENTQVSSDIQNITWIIPTVQSIHIFAVCVVVSSVMLLNLRMAGIIGGGETVGAFTRRYLPWVWIALAVLLTTGSILIVGEPRRDLFNPTFWTKMSLLVGAVAITFIVERAITKNEHYWDKRQFLARALATIAMIFWICIVLCGRWIAYTY